MSLSTEQIEKLAELCDWTQNERSYFVYVEGQGYIPTASKGDECELYLAGERIVIEKLEFCLTRIRGTVYIMLRDDGMGCETVIGEGSTLSQAIEAAVKAWLETQTGDRDE